MSIALLYGSCTFPKAPVLHYHQLDDSFGALLLNSDLSVSAYVTKGRERSSKARREKEEKVPR